MSSLTLSIIALTVSILVGILAMAAQASRRRNLPRRPACNECRATLNADGSTTHYATAAERRAGRSAVFMVPARPDTAPPPPPLSGAHL
jgi:hypothetical protein